MPTGQNSSSRRILGPLALVTVVELLATVGGEDLSATSPTSPVGLTALLRRLAILRPRGRMLNNLATVGDGYPGLAVHMRAEVRRKIVSVLRGNGLCDGFEGPRAGPDALSTSDVTAATAGCDAGWARIRPRLAGARAR